MSEVVTQAATEGVENGAQPKVFTQEQVDKIVQERLARVKPAVPDDYEALKAKAAKLDELEEAGKTEFEKLTERYTALEKEHQQLVHENEVRVWAAEVAKETGVPASVLRGTTKEDMQAHAKAILESGLSHYGSAPDNGEAGGAPKATKESIDSIKDPIARIKARAENLDIYR